MIEMDMMIESSVGFQMVNIVLLTVLIGMYVRNLVRVRSNFTVGLLIFASLLLAQNIAGAALGVGYMHSMTEPFETYAFFINIMETAALAALFWISWK